MNNDQHKNSEAEIEEQCVAANESSENLLQTCQKELNELQSKYLRAVADFSNYKRRTEQEQASWMDTAQSRILLDLLAICDDFERALDEHRKADNASEVKSWLQGYELIGKELGKLLIKYQVQEIVNYTTFDPEIHEALLQVTSEDKPSGSIVDVMQKGFMFKGKLLRPAKVSVVS